MPSLEKVPSYTSSYSPLTANDALKSYMSQLLKTASHADLTIQSGSFEMKVHKNIVSQCGFFAGACRKSSNFATGIVQMPEDEPCALSAMIEFLYTCDYTLDPTSSLHPLFTHAKIYATADKYCLPHLQQLATANFILATDSINSTNAEALRLDFLDAVEYLYSEMPEVSDAGDDAATLPLQHHAVLLAKHNSEVFFRRSSAGTLVYDKARQLLHNLPEFAIDMALFSYGSGPGEKQTRSSPYVRDLSSNISNDIAVMGQQPLQSPPMYDSDDEQEFV